MDTVSSFWILLDPRNHEDPLFPLDYMYHGIPINNMIQEVRSHFEAQTSACKVVWNMLHQHVMMCQNFINIANEMESMTYFSDIITGYLSIYLSKQIDK